MNETPGENVAGDVPAGGPSAAPTIYDVARAAGCADR